jgi:hypothetical protein
MVRIHLPPPASPSELRTCDHASNKGGGPPAQRRLVRILSTRSDRLILQIIRPAVLQIGRTGSPEMVTVLRLMQDVAADVRFLAAEVQMLKQRGAAFVSSPTGPTGISPGLGGFVRVPSEDPIMMGIGSWGEQLSQETANWLRRVPVTPDRQGRQGASSASQ